MSSLRAGSGVTTPANPSAGNADEKEHELYQHEHSSAAVTIDPELEKRVLRKIDWHVPPLVTFLL